MLRKVCAPLAALASAPALGQTPEDLSTYTPRFTATRIAAEEAPVIDGDLSDAAWAKAAILEDFYQVNPREGAAPSQKTRAYVMYDARNLYVAVYNFDTEPDKVRRKLLERDPPIQEDDAVRIFIDPFGTFRDGFFFATNPNGVWNDALIENNTTFRQEWNTIFDVSAKMVADGWIAEFAIPFQSISFDASLDEWGFQIVRTIARNNEEIRLANIVQARQRIDLTNPARMGGIDDITSGIGLEAQLFVTGSSSYDWELDRTDYDLKPSGNIFYKITPSLTGSLTFNTDFSDTPLDERQVDVGRFSLFFPETRDFFLQDAAVFEFGGKAFEQPNGLPFFSRRIGIVDGRPVDIVAGAKLSGKLGPASIGAIATRTGSTDAVDGQFLTAARASFPVFGESKAGLVFTHGDPAGEATNTVAGADFQYKTTTAFPGTLTADIAYQRSFDDGVEDDMATAHVAYRGQTWNWNLRAQTLGEDYNPRLGFVNRTGFHRANMSAWRTWRPESGPIRWIDTGFYVGGVTDPDLNFVDRFNGGWVTAQNHAGDELYVSAEYGLEFVTAPFNLFGRVPVPVEEFKFHFYQARLGLTEARPYSIGGGVTWGTDYGGHRTTFDVNFVAKPHRRLRLALEYDYAKYSLPAGDVALHIGTLDSTIAFSPRMALKTDIQYDNLSENFTFFSRLSWAPRPEQEIFFSLGHSAILDRTRFPESFRSLGSSFAVRLGHTFRL